MFPKAKVLEYYGLWNKNWNIKQVVKIQQILYLLSGRHSVFEIAQKAGVSFKFAFDFISQLKDKGLIQ